MTGSRGADGDPPAPPPPPPSPPAPPPSAASATAELARCREEIEQIDNEIVGLLARRLALGKRTATLKRAAGLPILDPTREAAVIRRVSSVAREAGLPSEPIREVFWQIVGMSRRAQENDAKESGKETGR